MGTKTSQTLIGSPISVSDSIAYQNTMPPGFGQFVTYGKNANGETIFKYVAPNAPGPGKWEITPDYRTIEVPNLNPDGSVVTNKQYYESLWGHAISPDGRSLVNTLPPGVRNVLGYGNDAKFVISGSGLENKITFSYANVFGAGQYSAILLNVGDVTDPYKQMEYLDKMSKYASGGYQPIRTTVTTTTPFDDLANQAKQLINDLGPIAPIALAVLAPGIGAAIGSALGIGSATAAAIVGNTLIQTVLNGGDVGKALTSSLVGAATAGIAGFAKDYISGGEFGSALASNSALASKVIGDVTYAALTGQDPGKALATSALGAAVDIGASKIDGFSGMKPEIQTAIKSSISSALQGKDINIEGVITGAAKTGLASYAATQIPGYSDLDPKYKQLAVNSVAGYLQGKSLTQTALDFAISQGRSEITNAVNSDKAVAEGWTSLTQKNDAAAAGYTSPAKYDDYLVDKKANEDAKTEGWTGFTQKSEAKTAGYTDPAQYDAYLVDKRANDAAIAAGWSGSTEKYTATTKGFDKPADYRTAVGLGIGTSAEYKDFQAKAPIYKEFTGKDATFNDIKDSSNLSVADFKNQISDKTEEEKVIAMLHDRGISPNAERVAAIMKGWDFNPATPSVGFSEAFDKSDKLSIANSRADSVQEAAALAKSLGYSGFSFGGSDYKINTSAPQGNPYDFFADKGEAFKAARADLGAGQVFQWTDPTTGKTGYYTTNYANEKVAGGGFDAGAAFNAKARLIDGLSDPSMNPADLKASEMANFVDGFVKATPQQRAAMLNGRDSLTYQQINNALTTTQQSLDDTYAAVKAGKFDPTKPVEGSGSISGNTATNYTQVVKALGNNVATDLASTALGGANLVGTTLGLDTSEIQKMQKLMSEDRDKQMSKLVGQEKYAAAGLASMVESLGSIYALGATTIATLPMVAFAVNNAWVEGANSWVDSKGYVYDSKEEAKMHDPNARQLTTAENATRAALMGGAEFIFEKFGLPGMAKLMKGIPLNGSPGDILNAVKNAGFGQASEQVSEALTTLAQMGIDKMGKIGLGQNATWGDVADALKDTMFTTMWAAGGASTIGSAAKNLKEINTDPTTQLWTQVTPDQLWSQAKDAGISQTDLNTIKQDIKNSFGSQSYTIQEVQQNIDQKLTDAGFTPQEIDRLTAPALNQEIIDKIKPSLQSAGVPADHLDAISSQVAQQILTANDQQAAFAGISTVLQNNGLDPLTSNLITNQTLTGTDVKTSIANTLKAQGYTPTQAELDLLVSQNAKANPTSISTAITDYTGPRLVTADEAKAALISSGLANPSQAQIDALTGQYDQNLLASRANTTAGDISTQLSSLDAAALARDQALSTTLNSISAQVAANQAAGMNSDQALGNAIDKVATTLGTTKEDLLTQMGKTEESLKTQFATDLSAVSTSFEAKLAASDAATKTAFEQMSADQKAEAKARVDQGETLQKSISDVQSGLGTQISDLATATQTQYNALSAADKAQADALVAQGKTLGDAIATVQSGVTELSQTVADQYASLTAAQKSQADALVAQGKTTAEAIATVQQSVAGLGETVADQYASLTAAQKAEVDARVQQGQDLQAAITSASQATAEQIAGLSQTQATQFGELTQGQKDLYNQMVAQGTTQSEALTQAQAALQEQIKTGQEQTNQAITNLDQATQTKFDTLTDAQKQQALQLANSTKDLKGSIDAVSSIVVANQTDTQAKFDELKASQEAQKVADAERERLRLIEDARKEEERKAAEKDAANKAASKSLLEKMVATQAAGRQTQLTKGLSSLESAWPTSAGTALAALTPSVLTSKEMKPQFQGALSQFQKLTAEPYAGENQYQGLAPIIQQDQAMNESPYYSYGQSQSLDDIFGQGSQQFGGDQSFIDPLQSMTGSYAAGGLAGTRYGKYAGGGMATPLMAAGGKLRVDFRGGDAVTGAGDGQSDDIPAMLADGEFVFPADVVAAIGNGSTKAGSDKLYDMMHGIRSHVRSAHPKELPPEIKSPLDFLKTKPRKARS